MNVESTLYTSVVSTTLE